MHDNSHNPMQKMLVEQLRDILDAEQQVVDALERMREKATHEELQQGLDQHLEETHQQIERLEKCFEHLSEDAYPEKCPAIRGILAEGKDLMKDHDETPAELDTAILIGAVKVEHYEISTYRTLLLAAHAAGHEDVAELLEQTLQEEEETAHKVEQLCEMVMGDFAREQSEGAHEHESSDDDESKDEEDTESAAASKRATSRSARAGLARQSSQPSTRSTSGGSRGGRSGASTQPRSRSNGRGGSGSSPSGSSRSSGGGSGSSKGGSSGARSSGSSPRGGTSRSGGSSRNGGSSRGRR